MPPPPLSTERLELLPITADVFDAWLSADAARLTALTGATFPEPVRAPPLMDDALQPQRDRLRAHPAEVGWWGWLVVLRATKGVVGSVGLAGRPDEAGAVLLGYSMYPEFERRGYATEAVAGLIHWVLAHPEVTTVRATIPPWNTPSIRVAEKVGMRQAGVGRDEEVGEVLVYEVRRDNSTRIRSRPPIAAPPAPAPIRSASPSRSRLHP